MIKTTMLNKQGLDEQYLKNVIEFSETALENEFYNNKLVKFYIVEKVADLWYDLKNYMYDERLYNWVKIYYPVIDTTFRLYPLTDVLNTLYDLEVEDPFRYSMIRHIYSLIEQKDQFGIYDIISLKHAKYLYKNNYYK